MTINELLEHLNRIPESERERVVKVLESDFRPKKEEDRFTIREIGSTYPDDKVLRIYHYTV